MKKQFQVLAMIFIVITLISCKKERIETETIKPEEINRSFDPVSGLDSADFYSLSKGYISDRDNVEEHTTSANVSGAMSARTLPKLNVTKFGEAMHKALKDSVVGYVLQLCQNGTPVYSLKWNSAQTPADASLNWEFNTRMHVASVSKYLTALGLMKALKLKGLSYDDKIIDYLPAFWFKGPNIYQISFRNLLTHTSGFVTNTSFSDYAFMKQRVWMGVGYTGSYQYENMNFGLMRILIPIIMGYVSKYKQMSDELWDMQTVSLYKSFMQSYVFSPSGVSNVDFKPVTPYALAYKFPHDNQDGWNSGNLASVSGGVGWRISVSELLKVMDHARRKGDILTSAQVQYGLDSRFGIDQVTSTAGGKIYNKNGRWGNSDGNTEQSAIFFFPGNMELAVLVNSPIGKMNSPLSDLVKNTFIASLE